MGVGDGVASGLIAGDHGVVAFHGDLSDAVNDLNAIGILVQIGESAVPVVAIAQGNGLAGSLTIGNQLNSDVVGTDAVLVIAVLPDLDHIDRGLLRSVGIGHVETIDLSGVLIHSIFSNGVDDLSTMILVLGQIVEAPAPVVSLGNGHGVNDLTIGQQVDGDGLGALAVLVVVVNPGLGTGNSSGLRGMGVGDGVAVCLIAVDCGGIAGHGNLSDGIGNLNTASVLVQLDEGAGPVVALVQDQGLVGFGTIGQQLNRNVLGTDAVLVIVILPCLGDSDGGLRGSVGVGHVEAVVSGRVVFNRVLGDGVDDLGAVVLKLRQFLEGPCPIVSLSNFDGLDNLTVSQQVDGDGLGTGTVLVILVHPGLGAGHFNSCGGMRIGDGVTLALAAGDDSGVAGDRNLIHGVDDFLAVLVLVQFGKGTGPVVTAAQNQSLAGIFLISQQLDSDIVGTDAVLVIIVDPSLGNGNGDLLRGIAVGHIVAIVGGSISLNSILGDGVDDLYTLFELGHILKGPGPAVGFGDSLGGDLCAIGQQVDGDGSRALAVLVFSIIPGLAAGDGDHSGDVGVGDGVILNIGLVAVHGILSDGILDFNAAISEFRQVLEGMGPAILCGDLDSFLNDAVGQQVDSDGAGAEAVLVVSVAPLLGHGEVDFGRNMGIGHIHAADSCGVAIDRFLADGVVDYLAVCVLVNIAEGPCPAVVSSDNLRCNLLAIGQQVDGDGGGTNAVLVVVIIPVLGTGDSNTLQLVGDGAGSGVGRAAVVGTYQEPGPVTGTVKLDGLFRNGNTKFIGSAGHTADKGISAQAAT